MTAPLDLDALEQELTAAYRDPADAAQRRAQRLVVECRRLRNQLARVEQERARLQARAWYEVDDDDESFIGADAMTQEPLDLEEATERCALGLSLPVPLAQALVGEVRRLRAACDATDTELARVESERNAAETERDRLRAECAAEKTQADHFHAEYWRLQHAHTALWAVADAARAREANPKDPAPWHRLTDALAALPPRVVPHA